jgi:hypothetical protein
VGSRAYDVPLEVDEPRIREALQEFAQSNQDFEGRRVAELILDTGERLTAFCLHEQVAGEAMIGLHRNFGLPDFPSDYVGERSWEALWAATPSVEVATLPLAQSLRSLNAYAFTARHRDPTANFASWTTSRASSARSGGLSVPKTQIRTY